MIADADVPVLRGEVNLFAFESPGPVASAYLASASPYAIIMGPAGSGKTTTSVVKTAVQTLRTPPCRDGVIRARGVVLRDNFRTLYRTTLPSWFRTFPRDWPASHFEGGQDRPAKHVITFRTPTGQLVEMTVDFFAVGDQVVEDLLKGYEITWAWANEADLLAENVIPFLYTRTGRYPSRADLRDPEAIKPRQVFADINPPDVDHFIYKNCVETPQSGWTLYQQPSGLSEGAENRRGVTRAEYEDTARNITDPRDRIRFVEGRFGYSNAGKPVYPDFDHEKVFASTPLPVLTQVPLHAGLDQGLSPALELFQVDPATGQVRFLAEVVPGHGIGPERFAALIVAKLQEPRFRLAAPGLWFADPAGFYGADRQNGELSWAQAIGAAIGRTVLPAPTQDFGMRKDALGIPLMKDLSAGAKMVAIDPDCPMLRKGLAAKYQFAKQRLNGSNVYGDRPVKNEWSHPVEAAQYGVLGVRGTAGIVAQAAAAARPGSMIAAAPPPANSADFNVWGV